MITHIQKLIKQARNGDPISYKVAQKIGVDFIEQKNKDKTECFDLRISNFDGSEKGS